MIRVLIADDEAPARKKLRELLAGEADFALAAEAADGVEAVAAIRATAPDLVFLDIQMPRLDGFGVVAQVGVEAMPLTVFVTAYDQHALRAFEAHALDYLLKPFAPARFARLLDRVRRQLGSPPGDLARRIESLLATIATGAAHKPDYLSHLLVDAIDLTGRQRMLAVARIDRIETAGNYLFLTTRDGTNRWRGPLKELLDRLDPASFLQINRSTAVRLEAIREVQPWFHGDARVILEDGTVLAWSRRYRSKVEGKF